MKKFKFFLVKWPNKRKNVEIKANNATEALNTINLQYNITGSMYNWMISMFWNVWP